jgi:hypothetical protein
MSTSAFSKISNRDIGRKLNKCIKGCNDDTQATIEHITTIIRKFRLVLFDRRGLPTDINDIQSFIRTNKAIVEVVVDLWHKVNIYTRHELLHTDVIHHFHPQLSLYVKRFLQQ